MKPIVDPEEALALLHMVGAHVVYNERGEFDALDIKHLLSAAAYDAFESRPMKYGLWHEQGVTTHPRYWEEVLIQMAQAVTGEFSDEYVLELRDATARVRRRDTRRTDRSEHSTQTKRTRAANKTPARNTKGPRAPARRGTGTLLA